jgi:hypothetical protein
MAVYLVAGALGLAGILLTVAGFKSGMTLVALLIAGGIVAGYRLEQVYSRHLSAVSHQLSAASHQLSDAGDQSSAVDSQFGVRRSAFGVRRSNAKRQTPNAKEG